MRAGGSDRVKLAPGDGELDLAVHVDEQSACAVRRGAEPVTLRLTEANCRAIVDAAEDLKP